MDIIPLLDHLQTIARNGLHYSENPYDIERYEKLLEVVTQQYGKMLDVQPELLRERFLKEIGYITPKVGAEAAMFNEAGEILLVKRSDDGRWCLPCGWMDPGEDSQETAIRETLEETGLKAEILQLVDVFTRKPSTSSGPHSAVAIVYLAKVVGGEMTLSHESTAIQYWNIEQVPAWHEQHELYAKAAQNAYLALRASGSL